MMNMRTILALVLGFSVLLFVGCNETKKTQDVPKPASTQQSQKPQGEVKGDVSEKDHDMMNKLQELVK